MSESGEVAEQLVRLTIDGAEKAIRLTGAAAERISVLIYTVMKDQHKTAGKVRLTTMLKSGKEQTVFTVPAEDLEAFANEAKTYGVLFCALKEKGADAGSPVDIMVYKEDASKINRIVERLSLVAVEAAKTENEAVSRENPTAAEMKNLRQSETISKNNDTAEKGNPETVRRSVRKEIDDIRKRRVSYPTAEEKEKTRGPYLMDAGRPSGRERDGRTR